MTHPVIFIFARVILGYFQRKHDKHKGSS